jgi:predicted nucleic acid-binding protein
MQRQLYPRRHRARRTGRPLPSRVEQLFAEANDLLVGDVVVAEALSGGDELELATIRALVASLEYVATHPEAAIRAGETRYRLGLTSARGLADAIIGGIARFKDAIVVTRNTEEFEVQGIRVLGYG